MDCPKCTEPNPAGARFCLGCGFEFASAVRVRKVVTMLFADVAGSTELAGRMDPESFSDLLSRFFGEMRAIVDRHGGSVERYVGDEIVAVFGIPVVHEDDAFRAVRAGTEMLARLDELNEELEAEWGERIQIRIGINTGEVVLGGGKDLLQGVMGDTANVAARLEKAAEPGHILIGELTHLLVRREVDVEPLAPLVLKGKGETRAFRLTRVASGTRVPRAAPLVGRDQELHLLEIAFERSRLGRSHLFTAFGPPGIGKSRLVEEFVARRRDDMRVLRGRCLSYGQGITFWPVAEVVKDAAGLADRDPPEDVTSKIAAALGDRPDAVPAAQNLGRGVGLLEGEVASEEWVWALRQLLEGLARRGPLIVVFEDTHWAEPAFLDLIEHLAEWTKELPLMVVCMARQDLLDRRPTWGAGKLNAISILLDSLKQEESARLTEGLLGGTPLDRSARSLILDLTQGNPLFVEEMLAMFVERGMLRVEQGAWVLSRHPSEISIPSTIQALLSARVEVLPDSERHVLQCASVVGKRFERGPLHALVSAHARARLEEDLEALVDKELFVKESSQAPGETFSFRHILLRDAAYSEIPKHQRAVLHERLASWFEATYAASTVEFEEILAYHFERAYKYKSELRRIDDDARLLARRAATHLAASGRAAAAREDNVAAVNLLTRATALLETRDPARVELLPELADALLSAQDDFSTACHLLEEAIADSETRGDLRLEAHARVVLLDVQLFMGGTADMSGGVGEVERIVSLFERADDDLGLARAYRLLAHFKLTAGQWGSAAELLERAIEHAGRAGSGREETNASWLLANAVFWGPFDVEEGIERCRRILERLSEHGRNHARVLGVMAALTAMEGRFADARTLIASSVGHLADLGISRNAIVFYEAPLEMLAGDFATAEHLLRQDMEQGEPTAASASTLAMLAAALYEQGRLDEAERATQQSEQLAGADDVFVQIMWRSVRARITARASDAEEARTLSDRAVELAFATDMPNVQADALMAAGEVASAGGEDPSELMRRAALLYRTKGNVVSAARAEALLAEKLSS